MGAYTKNFQGKGFRSYFSNFAFRWHIMQDYFAVSYSPLSSEGSNKGPGQLYDWQLIVSKMFSQNWVSIAQIISQTFAKPLSIRRWQIYCYKQLACYGKTNLFMSTILCTGEKSLKALFPPLLNPLQSQKNYSTNNKERWCCIVSSFACFAYRHQFLPSYEN